MDTKNILKGCIFYAELSPYKGSEQGGCRPVVVVQNDVGNRHSPTIIVAAITGKVAQKAKLPTHCCIGTECGLEMPSVILCEQIRTIDKSRLRKYVGYLNETKMSEVNKALAISLGLPGI